MCSFVRLFVTPWTATHEAWQSLEFFRQEYWSGWPFATPEDLPNLGIKPVSPVSLTLADGFFTTGPPGRSLVSALKTHTQQTGCEETFGGDGCIYCFDCSCGFEAVCACVLVTQWVRPFATPWTIAHQAPLSMEFSRQESWSG